MKLPLSWLKEFINTDDSPEKIADTLTMAGLEVEGVEAQELAFEGVIVGKVLATEPHPEAEKLCIAQVSDGQSNYQVVCGAPNCRAGLTTAFAKIGAKLKDPDGKVLKIKKGKLRGVESFGMLCSEKELGLGDANEGIAELDEALEAGTPLDSLHQETIFEVGLTPNLSHCFSIIGSARELAAAGNHFFEIPPLPTTPTTSESIRAVTSVTVEDPQLCPRYACRMVRGVKVGPSPAHIRKRLEAAGLRSVNNVVDATNYVLLETGHPLHAFDFDQLAGGRIVVKTAKAGDHFITLDGARRELSDESLMICDAEKPVAIAGVMGGANSEVSEGTQNLLIESAYFLPANIRRTSKRLGLTTDASKRFERGCNPNQVLDSLERVTQLIVELAGGEVLDGIIDEHEVDFPEKTIQVRFSRINEMLGTQLAVSEVEMIFNSLGLPFTWDGENTFTVTAPTYRVDLNVEIDLVEEVARIYGFQNIAKGERSINFQPSSIDHSPVYLFEKEVRRRMLGEGLQELITCDLISPKLSRLGDVADPAQLVSVQNPVSVEQSVLRASLLPGLLEVVKNNLAHYTSRIQGFEVGRIHMQVEGQFKEQTTLGIVLSGSSRPHHWDRKPEDVDFFDLKGILENFFEVLGVKGISFERDHTPFFHPGRQASLKLGQRDLGIIGEVHPDVARELDIDQRVYMAEVNLHELAQVRGGTRQMEALSQYPGSERDWTLTVSAESSVESVFNAIQSVPSKLLQKVELRDVYASDKLGKDRKNLTFRLLYRSEKKTLSQEAVEREHQRVVDGCLKNLGEVVMA